MYDTEAITEQHVVKAPANYFGIENWIISGTTQEESIVFKVTDSQGATGYQTVTFQAYGYDPIIIDLGNDGLEFIAAADSQVMLDRDGDGMTERVAWVKPSEAILAWDYNQDNVINRSDEIEFWSHINPLIAGITDLQVLSLPEFDENQDGKFDGADSKWQEFKLWQDLNSNGVSDSGELKTLSDAGIKSLYLNANVLNRHYGADVLVRGYTRVEMMDGTLLQAGDVKFNILPSDWVAPDTGPTSEQLYATSASADENQAIFSTQLKQQTTAREGSSYFDGGLQDQKVLTGESYQYVIPENLFASLGANATYELTQASVAPLPSWLHFNNATNTLYGTPTIGQLGLWQIKISGYQGNEEIPNLSDGGQFNLIVAESNQAPISALRVQQQSMALVIC